MNRWLHFQLNGKKYESVTRKKWFVLRCEAKKNNNNQQNIFPPKFSTWKQQKKSQTIQLLYIFALSYFLESDSWCCPSGRDTKNMTYNIKPFILPFRPWLRRIASFSLILPWTERLNQRIIVLILLQAMENIMHKISRKSWLKNNILLGWSTLFCGISASGFERKADLSLFYWWPNPKPTSCQLKRNARSGLGLQYNAYIMCHVFQSLVCCGGQ